MNQIENIACGATEPIETQDDEFVIGAQELHDRLKLRASSARCARACFGAEDFTARCLQPGNLDVEILVDGADAGVADAGHGQIRNIRVALPSYSNIGDGTRSEEHTTELQHLMSSTYAGFSLIKKRH